MVSIGCLIYKSTTYCDFVYDSLRKHTPMLRDGGAEFYFVANDATDDVLEHLCSKGYRFHAQMNTPFTDEQNEPRGIAKPEYLARVYKGCNRIFSEASGDTVVMVSSDMAFSPYWLEALLYHQDGTRIVTSQLVEPPESANISRGSYPVSFGTSPNEFDEAAFLDFVEAKRKSGIRLGGQYVPVCIPMKLWHMNGCYPEGNVVNGDEWGIPGDRVLHERYARLGSEHVTATDSVVYHFVGGESNE